MAEAERCPICHTILETDPTKITEYREEGIYCWKHDPIKTLRGLAGEDYKGIPYIYKQDIEELQEARKEQEEAIGISEEERTTFTTVPETGFFIVNKKHIRELRQSIEKILKEMGMTNTEDVDLEQYFNYNEEGEYIGTYKYGEKITDKTEWVRVNRNIIGYEGEPYMPKDMTHIYALDIEELRHPIPIGWFERWNITESQIFENHNWTPDGIWFDYPLLYVLYSNYNTKNLTGDRGIWNIEWREEFLGSYEYDISPVTFRITQTAIDDGSGNSSKINQSIDVINQAEFTSHFASSILEYSKYPNTVWKVKTTSRISFDAIINISYGNLSPNFYQLYVALDLWITGSGYNKHLYYYNGISDPIRYPPGYPNDIILTQEEFENFNRNIYDDLISKFGSIPPTDIKISTLKFLVINNFQSEGYSYNTGSVSLIVDNIKIT